MKTIRINDGVRLHCYTDHNFKTFRISVNMLIPLTPEDAAKNGLLPAIVSRASREYPDYTAMSAHLADLYGAYIDSGVGKLGSYQMLSISVGGIANQYAFLGENIEAAQCALLFSVLFDPLRDADNLFPEDGFLQEKRQVLELFDSEFNDKIYYARRRAMEIFYGDAPAGINRYGKKEDVEKLSREEVTAAWAHLMKHAQFEIFALGDCHPDESAFREAFQGYGINYHNAPMPAEPIQVKHVTEDMQLAQSKLVMAYRSKMQNGEQYIYKLMSTVLGGTPSSKLFANVREKMSLCYYCSSGFDAVQAVMTVESGVETENIEKTKEAASAQLEEMKAGNISDEELLHARLALSNAYRSVTDSLSSVEYWYMQRALSDEMDSPREAIKKIEAVTKEDLVRAANTMELDTVYVLKGVQ